MNWKLCVAGVVLVGVQSVFAQGSLTPPSAPAPAMKTLDQGEPRTPISSVPYTISEPGSYYLTTNLTTTADYGVIIRASGVTLDLMGFALSGGGMNYGVFVDGATNRVVEAVVVRNGAVKNFHIGIRAEYSLGGRFEQLAISDNISDGVYFYGRHGQCNGNTFANCSISGNGTYGVYLNGESGQCAGNTMADCTLSGNGSDGVYLDGQSGQCDGNTLADCTLSGNGRYGVDLAGNSSGQCNGNTISDCTIRENGDYGVYLYGNHGQCAGNTVADCTIQKNKERGIVLYFAEGNRVEGNHVIGQTGDGTTYGIYCSTTMDNLILRNTCMGQTNNFLFNSDDTYGPEVTASGALSATGAGAHPLANFSFNEGN